MAEPRLKVLYVLGSSRSGSTLLADILNELEGFTSVGEVRWFWDRILRSRLCGCGKPIPICDMWSRVLSVADPRTDHAELERVVAWQSEAVRVRHTLRLLRTPPRLPNESAIYLSRLTNLYRSVAEITRARVLVDSSKRPSDGALLALLPEVSAYYIHLIRDPRAVAYSGQRRKANPDGSPSGEMPRAGLAKSIVEWIGYNLGAEGIRRRFQVPMLTIRYEDFVSDPARFLRTTLELVGERVETLPLVDQQTVLLRGNHGVAGNPSRFVTGKVSIREDDQWVGMMPSWQKLVIALCSGPLMRRYRYPFLQSRSRRSRETGGGNS